MTASSTLREAPRQPPIPGYVPSLLREEVIVDELAMASFAELFGCPAEVAAEAPGCVNLLGEHGDHNEGVVLSTAIPQRVRVQIAAADPDATMPMPDSTVPQGFAHRIHACGEILRRRGIEVPPLLVRVTSDLPTTGGLSVSAALDIAFLRALRRRLNFDMNDVQLALCARAAAREYLGVEIDMMEWVACSLGQPGEMLYVDSRSLETHRVPLPPGAGIVVIDSGVPQDGAHVDIDIRRAECERAARFLGVRSLRDVTDEHYARALPSPLDRRARHVIAENVRVAEAVGATPYRFGELMNASHASLRDDYQVSTPALDALGECLRRRPPVYGARLAAGFGGACVALVSKGSERSAAIAALEDFEVNGYAGRVLVAGTSRHTAL